MSYELKKLLPEDQSRIISASKIKRSMEVAFSILNRDGGFPEYWAISSHDNSFLVLLPSVTRPEGMEIHYAFFSGKKMYELVGTQSYLYYMDIEILDIEGSSEDMKMVRTAISNAFNVYGRWGEGPNDKNGLPQYKVEARFKSGGVA